jgi:hypothetical protein
MSTATLRAERTDPFLAALGAFEEARGRLLAVGKAQAEAEQRLGIGSTAPELLAIDAQAGAAVEADIACLAAAIRTKPTTAAGARALLDLAARERPNLDAEDLAVVCAHVRLFIGAPEAGAPPRGLSPAFVRFAREREALRHAAEATAAAAAVVDGLNHGAAAEAADAALRALWAADNRLMATPAVVPADLGAKARYLAEQLEAFGQLEPRHCRAIVADLLRIFPTA